VTAEVRNCWRAAARSGVWARVKVSERRWELGIGPASVAEAMTSEVIVASVVRAGVCAGRDAAASTGTMVAKAATRVRERTAATRSNATREEVMIMGMVAEGSY
jgi:hypothetical protein